LGAVHPWVIGLLKIQRPGAVIVPVSPICTSHELEYMIEDSGANTVTCLDTNYCSAKAAGKTVSLDHVIVTNPVDLLPAWKRSLRVLLNKIPRGKVERGSGVPTFKTLLKHASLESPVDIDPMEDLSYILYTTDVGRACYSRIGGSAKPGTIDLPLNSRE
jgi:long-chain acyl-CoA synthetase